MFEKMYKNGFLVIGLIFSAYYILMTLYPLFAATNASIKSINTGDIILELAYGILIFINLFLIKKVSNKKGILRIFVILLTTLLVLRLGFYLRLMLGGLAYVVTSQSEFSNTIFSLGKFPNFIPLFFQAVLVFLVNIYALVYLFGFYKNMELAERKTIFVKILIPVSIMLLLGLLTFWYHKLDLDDERARKEMLQNRASPVFSGDNDTTIETITISISEEKNTNKTYSIMNGEQGLYFNDIHFIDKDNGVAVGGPQLLITTTHDGGKTWKRMFHTKFADSFKAVDFFDKNTGIAVGSNKIYTTNDGGNTWSFYNPKIARKNHKYFRFFRHARFWDVKYITNNIIIVVGDDIIIRSTDGGKKWQKIKFHFMKKSIFQTVKFYQGIGWTVGSNGVVLNSFDQGETWHYIETGVYTNLNDIVFFDDKNIYATGQSNILLTSDSGKVWDAKFSESGYNNKINHSQNKTVWQTKNSSFAPSRLLRTTNNGKTWETVIEFDNSIRILATHPIDDKTIFITGDKGMRVKIQLK